MIPYHLPVDPVTTLSYWQRVAAFLDASPDLIPYLRRDPLLTGMLRFLLAQSYVPPEVCTLLRQILGALPPE